MAEEDIIARRKLAIWQRWERGDSPIVASPQDVEELRAFYRDKGIDMEPLTRNQVPMQIYGTPVVNEAGEPWIW